MEENLEHSEWMKGIKGTGFTTPSNYFEELNEGIKAKISVERLKSAVGTDGYAVPAGYFEQLQSNILARTTGFETEQIRKPKIVRLWRSGLLKYASAACFVIMAGAGLYFNMNQPSTAKKSSYSDIATEQMLFDIDEDVIIEHIEASSKEAQNPGTSQAALENYILSNYSQNDLSGNL
ncbi:MAG: hypothetical protein V4594_08985 [Bacteroidota bacterium]